MLAKLIYGDITGTLSFKWNQTFRFLFSLYFMKFYTHEAVKTR